MYYNNNFQQPYNPVPTPTPQVYRDSKFNPALIPVTLIAGIAAWFAGLAIYAAFEDSMPRPLLIGIIFLVLNLILNVVIFLFSNITGAFEKNILTGDAGGGSVILALAVSLLLTLGMGALFEWIYEIDFAKEELGPTSYIFVIDDSGSMQANDPAGERYAAISTVLGEMDGSFPYMIYRFANDVSVIKDMAPISQGIPQVSGYSEGGTAIKAALTRVIDDYEAGVWDGGKSPKVILLTDGYAGDIGFFSPVTSVLKRFVKADINISTVGLGEVDESLMNKIAGTTGGVFIDISNASDLSEAMTSAASHYSDRNLLSTRYTTHLNVLYGIFRVVFLTVLGSLIGFTAAVAYGNEGSAQLILLSSVVKSFAGALLMELGTGVLGFSDKFMWLLLWLLIAVTIGTHYVSRSFGTPTVTPAVNMMNASVGRGNTAHRTSRF